MAEISCKKSLAPKSLVRASLELGRLLADCDGVTFRARGTCMYPAIKYGDVLRVECRKASEVGVGEIAVCRRPRHLIAHRVIGKDRESGRPFILTRPDRSVWGNDGPTFDEDLLGVVTRVERNGRPVPLTPAPRSRVMRHYFAFRASLLDSISLARIRLTCCLEPVQRHPFYRRIAGKCMEVFKPRISFQVRLPFPRLGDSLFRPMAPESFDTGRDWRGRPVNRWTLALHLNARPRPTAWATFLREKEGGWRVDEFWVDVAYRGSGLDDVLFYRAAEIMVNCGDTKGSSDSASSG